MRATADGYTLASPPRAVLPNPALCSSCWGVGYLERIMPGFHPAFGTVSKPMLVGAACPECGRVGVVEGEPIVPFADLLARPGPRG